MNINEFEGLLDLLAERLGDEVRQSAQYHGPQAFQQRTLQLLKSLSVNKGLEVDPTFHPSAFPDIRANGFGIEVKTTSKDSWQSVGNSVFEGQRDEEVQHVYVLFGKMGGMPGVRWGRYGERVTHVRISHAPRFVIEMDRDSSLFEILGIDYDTFAQLPPEEKMAHIREYSRGRLQPGDKLWWLEDRPAVESAGTEPDRTLPLTVRLYINLSPEEKIKIRAEAAILCPEIVKPSRSRGKYNNVALFAFTHRGVVCLQARDLFSAGSVAMRSNDERGGNYVLRALQDIQQEMREAAQDLPDDLIEEYWGVHVPAEDRIEEWLRRADRFARDWVPSEHLFLE